MLFISKLCKIKQIKINKRYKINLYLQQIMIMVIYVILNNYKKDLNIFHMQNYNNKTHIILNLNLNVIMKEHLILFLIHGPILIFVLGCLTQINNYLQKILMNFLIYKIYNM